MSASACHSIDPCQILSPSGKNSQQREDSACDPCRGSLEGRRYVVTPRYSSSSSSVSQARRCTSSAAEAERELALVLNTCRRHMTAEQRREQVLRLKGWGWSNPRIAEVIGCSDETVRTDLQRSGSKDLEPEHVTGSDSKQYPATKPTTDALNARQERVKAAREEGQSVRSIAKAEGVSRGEERSTGVIAILLPLVCY